MIPVVDLPRGESVRQAADACRVALEHFATLEPTHAALARWLATSYRTALVGESEHWPLLLRTTGPVEALIVSAQERIAKLRRSARSASGDFVAELPSRVTIARIRDESGNEGFGPSDACGAALDARVLSLLLADYLTRPEDYLTAA